MPNHVKGQAVAQLKDGRKLTLQFDIDALIEAETASGLKMRAMQEELGSGDPSLKLVRGLIFGGLQAHHSDLTLKEAGQLILSDGEAVITAMNEGVTAAFNDGETAGEEEGGDNATENPPLAMAKSGTGTGS